MLDENVATEPLENNFAAPPRWAGLKQRILSGTILAAVALGTLVLGGWLFTMLVIAAALIAEREWDTLTKLEKPGWKVIGLAYVAIPCASLIWLRHLDGGLKLVLFVILIVCATDIGAYVAGRLIGGAKLAPNISPNKTWAGVGGGIGSALVMGGIGYSFTPYPVSFFGCIGVGILLSVFSQAGDLFESWLKRRSGAKDSGKLIPGHGGLLDRIDGMMFAVPVFALLVYLGNA